MKIATVSSSMLAKYGRWDAGFYLGRTEETAKEVEEAKAAVETANKRLKRAKEAHEAEVARSKAIVKSGEVKPMD